MERGPSAEGNFHFFVVGLGEAIGLKCYVRGKFVNLYFIGCLNKQQLFNIRYLIYLITMFYSYQSFCPSIYMNLCLYLGQFAFYGKVFAVVHYRFISVGGNDEARHHRGEFIGFQHERKKPV